MLCLVIATRSVIVGKVLMALRHRRVIYAFLLAMPRLCRNLVVLYGLLVAIADVALFLVGHRLVVFGRIS